MKKTLLYLLIAVAIVGLIGMLLVPETGELTLWNEVFSICMILSVEILLVKSLIFMCRSKKYASVILVLATAIAIGVVLGAKTINVAKDVAVGPERVQLYKCELERRGTSRGIFSLNYYLLGIDHNGDRYRFSISAEDYDFLAETEEITILCYKNTERIVSLEKVRGIYE